MNDSVNHPSHYNAHPSGVECITITEHMNFNVGNAIKYLWRAGLKFIRHPEIQYKPGELIPIHDPMEKHLEDLKKARWYIDREIQRLTANPQPGSVTYVKK